MHLRNARNVTRFSAALLVLSIAGCRDAAVAPTAPEIPSAPVAARANLPPQAQARLERIRERAMPDVMSLPGTVFADNDEVAGRVVFGVEHPGAANSVRQAMARLGVSPDDYSVEITQPIRQMVTLRDMFNPTQAGIQLHFGQYLCTLGFNIPGGTKGSQTYGRSFITNSHCTNRQGGTEGTTYYQPVSTAGGGIIATEADDPKYVKGGICPKGRTCRYSDASRALYASGTNSNVGEIARTTGANNGSLTVDSNNPFFSITAQNTSANPAPVGTVVNKVGRTTGWTQGTVTRTCVHTGVQGSQVMQLCQTFVSNNSAIIVNGGDSGSSVWTSNGNGVTLVGLLWGGSSDNKTFIFSPLAQVQQELGTFNAIR